MYKVLSVFVLITLIFCLSNCRDDIQSPYISAKNEIVPLQIGNWWQYIITDYDSLGNQTRTFYSKNWVLGDTLLDGKTWYKIIQAFSSKYETYTLLRNDPGYGLYSRNFYDNGSQLAYKYPCLTGQKFNDILVVNLNVKVSLDIGAFPSVQYRVNVGYNAYWDIYVVPNLGVIKELGFQNKKLIQAITLIDYKLNRDLQ